MKKKIVSLLVALIFILVGCGVQSPQETQEEKQSNNIFIPQIFEKDPERTWVDTTGALISGVTLENDIKAYNVQQGAFQMFITKAELMPRLTEEVEDSDVYQGFVQFHNRGNTSYTIDFDAPGNNWRFGYEAFPAIYEGIIFLISYTITPPSETFLSTLTVKPNSSTEVFVYTVVTPEGKELNAIRYRDWFDLSWYIDDLRY